MRAPIAFYKMDENAANKTVVDTVGGHNGTSIRNTSVIHSTSIAGNGFTFDGGADYIALGQVPAFVVANKTVTFRISPAGVAGGIQPILSNQNANYYLGINSDALHVSFTNTAEAQISSVTSTAGLVTTGDHVYAIVFSISGANTTISFYKDGVFDKSVVTGGGYGVAQSGDFILGAFGANTLGYAGVLGSVKFYDTALTVDEIRMDYSGGTLTKNIIANSIQI